MLIFFYALNSWNIILVILIHKTKSKHGKLLRISEHVSLFNWRNHLALLSNCMINYLQAARKSTNKYIAADFNPAKNSSVNKHRKFHPLREWIAEFRWKWANRYIIQEWYKKIAIDATFKLEHDTEDRVKLTKLEPIIEQLHDLQ